MFQDLVFQGVVLARSRPVHGLTGSRAHGLTGSRAHGPTGPRAHGPTGPRAHGPTGPPAQTTMPENLGFRVERVEGLGFRVQE